MSWIGGPVVGLSPTIIELFTGRGNVHAINTTARVTARVVGTFQTAPIFSHAFQWQDGNIADLQAPIPEYQPSSLNLGFWIRSVYFNSEAFGTNAAGAVVGVLETTTTVITRWPWAVREDQTKSNDALLNMVKIFPGSLGINAAGQVVDTGWSPRRAVLWQDGVTTDLVTPPPDSGISEAYAINDNGQVVGSVLDERGGFIWQNGEITSLGIIPRAINNAGTVAGYEGIPGDTHAFLWQDGIRRALPELPGDTHSDAHGVNAAGQVVGSSMKFDSQRLPIGLPHAVMWQNGVIHDLTGMLPAGSGWTLHDARAINDLGQIVGMGVHNGAAKGYLLTPHNLTNK